MKLKDILEKLESRGWEIFEGRAWDKANRVLGIRGPDGS